MNVRIVAEKRNVLSFRQQGHACAGMRVPDRAKEWGSEEDVSDRAEANHEDVRRVWQVGHGEKVQRER
jgi:hypothetical protein